jgi:hypothetical protein
VINKKEPTAANEELDELRELVENSPEVGAGPASNTQSRRNLLKLAGAALAGAAGAAALRVIPAAASDGQAVLQGCLNLADSTTTLTSPGTNQGPMSQTGPAFIARSSAGLRGAGYYAADRNQSIGVLGLSKNDIDIFGPDPLAPGPGTGVMGIIDSGIAIEGDANTGVGGRFLSNTGYDVQLGALAGDAGIVGSGRLAMIGRGDVGGTAPNWAANFYVHSSLGILNFQHELVRGNDSSIWASRYDDTSPTRTRWKRINAVRVDTADGLGHPFTPYRVYDSRAHGAKKAVGSTTTVPVAGQGTGNSAIPADAIAVIGNLTATGYTAPGFLALSPNGVTVGTSSVNFITGQAAIANSFVVGLAGGAVQVKVAGSATHFIIDITGYMQ